MGAAEVSRETSAYAETRGKIVQTPGIRQINRERDVAIRAGAKLVAPELNTIQAAIIHRVARAPGTAAALAEIRRMERRQPEPLNGDDLAGALAGVILGGLIVGRFHALRDIFEPTLVFAEKVPRLPASWSDDRIVRRAIGYLEGKDLLRPREFARLTESAKHSAFKIAGVTRKSALALARSEVQRGISLKQSPEQVGFRLNRRFEAAGYQALRPWHAELVAEQNFLNAYGAASWEALHDPRVAGILPFFRYYETRLHTGQGTPRPAHVALDGLYLKRDNPEWRKWWPPNGFRCWCAIFGVTVNTVRLYGIVEDTIPATTSVRNAKGETKIIRVEPDKGFGSNPGAYLARMARAAR